MSLSLVPTTDLIAELIRRSRAIVLARTYTDDGDGTDLHSIDATCNGYVLEQSALARLLTMRVDQQLAALASLNPRNDSDG